VVPGAVLQNLFVVLKLLPLAVLAVLGLVFAQGDPMGPFAGETLLPSSRGAVWALAAGLGPVLFAFGGWQQLNFVADEITAPRRTIPRALLIGIAIVITVYLAVNVAYLWGLGASGLANSKAPAADTMYATFGDRGRWLISLGIIVSTFGFLDLVLLVTPRVFQAMAANGQLPARLARLHPRYQTPVAGIVFQAVWSSILAGSNTYGALLDYVVFGDWIFFGATVATLFVFRSRQPGNADGEEAGGYRLPGYPVVPALFVMAAAYVVVGSIVSNPINAAIGSGLIALGVPAYHWLGNRGEGPPPA